MTHGDTLVIDDDDDAGGAPPTSTQPTHKDEEPLPDSQVPGAGWLGRAYMLYNALDRQQEEDHRRGIVDTPGTVLDDQSDHEGDDKPPISGSSTDKPQSMEATEEAESAAKRLSFEEGEEEEIPLVTRREQLGTDDKALASGEGPAEGDEDFEAGKPNECDLAEAAEAPKKRKRTPKVKAAAKAKLTPEAKKAAAAEKARARRQAKAEEKKIKEQENKAKARKLCGARPHASSAGGEVESEAGGEEHMDADLDAVGAKAEVAQEEAAESAAGIEGGSKEPAAGIEGDSDLASAEPKKKARLSESKEGKGETFAARYMPGNESKAIRFRAIRDVFVKCVAGKLKSQSRFQDLFMELVRVPLFI